MAPSQKPDLQSLTSSQGWLSSQAGGVAPTPQGLPAGAPHAPITHLPLAHCSFVVQPAPVHCIGHTPPQSSPSSPGSFVPFVQLGPAASSPAVEHAGRMNVPPSRRIAHATMVWARTTQPPVRRVRRSPPRERRRRRASPNLSCGSRSRTCNFATSSCTISRNLRGGSLVHPPSTSPRTHAHLPLTDGPPWPFMDE